MPIPEGNALRTTFQLPDSSLEVYRLLCQGTFAASVLVATQSEAHDLRVGGNEPKGLFQARGDVSTSSRRVQGDVGSFLARGERPELAGCSVKVRLAYHQQRTPTLQEGVAIDIGALNRRVADLKI